MAQGSIITITDDSAPDIEGDEQRTFIVAECDDDGDLVGRMRWFEGEAAASRWAHAIAHGREVHWD